MSSRPPRRHHTVPQFYLRSFADDRGRVRVVARDGSADFITSTANAFVERDYYTVASVHAEDDHGLIEGLYAEVEGQVAPVLEKLRDDEFPLDGQDRADFAAFLSLQVTRGREFRQMVGRVTEQLGRVMMETAATAPDEYWAREHEEWEKTREDPEPPPYLTAEQRNMLTDADAFDISPSREHVVEISFVAVEEMSFLLMSMTWKLLRFDRPCLFSSEHPLSYWRKRSSADRFLGIGPANADEVRFPLSPTRALVLVPPEPGRRLFEPSPHERICDANTVQAKQLNWGTLSFPPSHRLLLCPDVMRHDLPANIFQR
jgi:hypothetical protein